MIAEDIIKNNFESKCSIKIESNSRGYTTSVHIYQGILNDEIIDTINKAIFANQELQKRLANGNEAK